MSGTELTSGGSILVSLVVKAFCSFTLAQNNVSKFLPNHKVQQKTFLLSIQGINGFHFNF